MARLLILFVLLGANVQIGVQTAAVSAAGSRITHEAQALRPPGQWSMLQNGPARHGRTPVVGPQSSNLLWRISPETNYGGAVIGRDGTAYIGNLLGQFLAVRPDGTIKWTISLSHTVESTPAILLDGRIAFDAANGTLFVLNPDGSPSWSFETGVTCTCTETSPAIGRDGTIYFASGEILYALYPDGSVRWTYDSVYDIVGPPAVTPDGVVYLPSGALIAVDANGAFLWQSPLFAPQGTPAIGVDGTIYVNSASPIHLYALTPDGALKWRNPVVGGADPGLASSPAIGADGTIYVGETVDVGGEADGLVLAINRMGRSSGRLITVGGQPPSRSVATGRSTSALDPKTLPPSMP